MRGKLAKEMRKAADYDRESYQYIKKLYKKLKRAGHKFNA